MTKITIIARNINNNNRIAVITALILTIRWIWSELRPEYNIVEGIRRTDACNTHHHIIL